MTEKQELAWFFLWRQTGEIYCRQLAAWYESKKLYKSFIRSVF